MATHIYFLRSSGPPELKPGKMSSQSKGEPSMLSSHVHKGRGWHYAVGCNQPHSRLVAEIRHDVEGIPCGVPVYRLDGEYHLVAVPSVIEPEEVVIVGMECVPVVGRLAIDYLLEVGYRLFPLAVEEVHLPLSAYAAPPVALPDSRHPI